MFGLLSVFVMVVGLVYFAAHEWVKKAKREKTSGLEEEKKKLPDLDAFTITPLPDFKWQDTEPLKFRNFKPKYHLTMSITTSHLTSLIEMDRNYLSRLHLRKQIIRDHHETVIQAAPSVAPAVRELYTWLVGSYLPIRFPGMFERREREWGVLNRVTGEVLPFEAPGDPVRVFELLGENLDEDFLILEKENGFEEKGEDGSYVLKGFVTCFPAGFDTKEKFGLRLRDIHRPVPGYKQKLERSMDRFFERLEVGRVVMRSNWSITTHDRLFAAREHNHLYEGEEVVEEEVDIDNTYLRCERQLLHRLPNTKAMVFSFKTYLYPIRELKEEGSGPELADAIEGLKEGSVPQMWFYKRGVVWGKKVCEFLRS